jgi:thymidylate synthase
MATSYFFGPTLDDVMHDVVEEVLSRGELIRPTKGDALEIAGVMLEISNPRARLSRTETRGMIFSALGELLWYLSGSNEVEFITYYIKKYGPLAEDGKIFGGYGPRLLSWNGAERSWKGADQISNVTKILQANKDSRKAVIQLFDSTDIAVKHKDVPCTCTLQFMLRAGKLHLFTNMRSNDVHLGLPHDVFCFTMIQEILAASIGAELGSYKHAVGSMHLYVKDKGPAQRFLKEGFQRTIPVMQPMPREDPWNQIERVLIAEAAIRKGSTIDPIAPEMDPYWADLVRLLQVFAAKKRSDLIGLKRIGADMANQTYVKFIDRLGRILAAASPVPSTGDKVNERSN